MTYIYLLSDYEEHGAEHVVATLDRSKLQSMLDKHWPEPDWEAHWSAPMWAHATDEQKATRKQDWLEVARANDVALAEFLLKPDAELADGMPKTLGSGWGGIQLHVVELE